MNSIKSSPHSRDMIEAPSPAPVPILPSVIHAESTGPLFISRCQYIMDLFDDKVIISIRKTDINRKFIKVIENTSDTWMNFHNHFQNDFAKFYELLNSSLKGESEHLRTNVHYLNGQIQLTLMHEGLFPFTIMLILEKEKDKIDLLEDTVNRLLRENIYLKQQNETILSKIKNINDFEFLEIQGGSQGFVDNFNPHSLIANYSGEEMTSFDNMKQRMIDNNYTLCIMYQNKLYYQGAITGGWRCSLQCFDICSKKEMYENTKSYICIPKEDIKNIGPGVGILGDYQNYVEGRWSLDSTNFTGKRFYHGSLDTYNGPVKKNHSYPEGRRPNITPHMFCVRDKFVRSDIGPDICEPCGEYSQIRFNDGRTGRVPIPSTYYCTNCHKIGSGDGYTVYECLGH